MSKAAECQKKVQPAGEAETTKKQENLKESPMSKVSTPLFRKRRGVTFIELIGVLVVAIIIIAGALALYSEANTSSRTNQMLVAVGALTGSVRALHANAANYGGEMRDTGAIRSSVSLLNVLVNANAIPPGLLIVEAGDDFEVKHAFGGDVKVEGFGQLFGVAVEGLDQDICIRVSTESTAKASSGLRGVYVGDSTANNNISRQVKDAATLVVATSEDDDATTGGSVAEGEGIFVTTSTTGLSTAASAYLPVSPTLADLACKDVTNNMILWVFQ
jgi:hypothetical protein